MLRFLCLLALAAFGCEGKPKPSLPCSDFNALKNVYFGDLHVHTSFSFDAYDYGTRSDPAAAYAFARGAKVDVVPSALPSRGQTKGPLGVKIAAGAPKLDFMAVTDHAEFLGATRGCTRDKQSGFYDEPYCVAQRTVPDPNFQDEASATNVLMSPCVGKAPNSESTSAEICTNEMRSAWTDELEAANAAYEQCTFTTLHGFEWTGVSLDTMPYATLHRNVFFANDNVPMLPLDFIQYRTVTGLWQGLEENCTAANGCEALTIPHNSNQSMGRMFDISHFTAADLERAARYQKLVEIHQHKGNSECLTDTADSGEVTTCDFEIEGGDAEPISKPAYIRPALEQGLKVLASSSANPLQLGFVGGTDTHNATPGYVGEETWPGHTGVIDNTPALRLNTIAGQNPGGLTGVWAEQNTRESIWAALMRRESFATSGPRIKLRFYQVPDGANPCDDPAFPSQLVAAGAVPMGGTFQTGDRSPRFVVYALEDQTPLAAADMIKASAQGQDVIERVHTLPLSGAPYCLTWSDPDFHANAPAFYYVRVREQPTWRWSHYDCEALRASNPSDWQTIAPGCASSDPKSGGQDIKIEERAWSSPIWYVPRP